MGRGKFKGKPTGRRQFSTPEQMMAGTSASRPRTFKKVEAELEEEERSEEESEEESEDESGAEIDPPMTIHCRSTIEEIERQQAHERYMRLQEQGKTEQARKDLERLALIRQQRAEAAKKREEEKTAKEQKKLEARK
ncbi:unnamed protein product [Fraxinus pennsylvanica]|uniref:Casein kinase substrate phosphoprotein PP28 domain-containing protein n=1 Tax=Fraxinus pennsylvanica TaxID=56036 RepID=A0AAD2ACC6_9LAMI|nr:unnamed protein product [Fraxinus pennsylvanica]